MRKILLFLFLLVTFVSCKEIQYMPTYESFQKSVQNLQTELENDGFGLNGYQCMIGTEINDVVTFNYRNGVSVSVPDKEAIYRDTYFFKNGEESFEYSITYQLEPVWQHYVCVKDVHVEKCSGSTPSIFEKYRQKTENLPNIPTSKIERVNPVLIACGFLGGFFVTIVTISYFLH